MTHGRRIRARRKELGLTLDGLAARSGLSKTFLCEIETRGKGLGAESLASLSRALGLSMDAIMRGEPGGPEPGSGLGLPPSLARLARDIDLSFRDVVLLQSLGWIALQHRGKADRAAFDAFDWAKFHQAVKEWL